MKKTSIIILTVMFLLLSVCFAGCNLFRKPDDSDTPNNTNSDTVYDLSQDGYGLSVSLSTYEFIYSGQPCTPTVTVKYYQETIATVEAGTPHSDLTVEYSDNVEMGRATCVVKAKSDSKKFISQRKIYFQIKGNEQWVYATDFTSLKQHLSSKLNVNVAIGADIEIPEGESIEILPTTTLHIPADKGRLTNHGEIINHGNVDAFYVTNYGKLVNDEGACFSMQARGSFVNHGQIENSGEFKTEAALYESPKIYADSALNFTTKGNFEVFIRRPMTGLTLKNASYIYTGAQIVPELDVGTVIEINRDYTVQCENNVNVGKYSVTFIATELSKFYIGQVTLEYEITHASFTTTNADSFLIALQNPNYNVITYNSTYSAVKITTLPNVTVNVSKCDLHGVNLAANSVLNVTSPSTIKSWGIDLGDNAEMNLSGKMVVYGTIEGSGKFNLSKGSELYFDFTAPAATAEINNEGGVYADFDLSGVKGDGEKIVRRQLTKEEITVEQLEYTGDDLTVDPSFEHKADVTHSVSYYFDGKFTDNKFPRDAGDYRARITFSERNKYFKKTAEFDFTVEPGTAHVRDYFDLLSAMKNKNYDGYAISELQIREPFTVNADTTLTVSTLINNSQITVNGTLSVFDCTNHIDKSITVASGGSLILRGNFYNVGVSSQLVFEEGSSFENTGSGATYLCKDDIPEVTGQKYIRTRDLQDAQCTDFEEAVYGGNTTPLFKLLYDGSPIDKSEYQTRYSDYFARTAENGAHVYVTAKIDDPLYYGTATGNYTVKPGQTTVNTCATLREALGDGIYGLCNYDRIETTGNITLFDNDVAGQVDKYNVQEGTTLIVKHSITFYKTPNLEKYSFINDGVMEIHEGVKLDDRMWGANENTGVFKRYVASITDFNETYGINFSYYCLQSDIYLSSTHLYLRAKVGDFILDLNGFKIYGHVKYTNLIIYTYGHSVTVRSGNIGTKLNVPSTDNAGGHVYLERVERGSTNYPFDLIDPLNIVENR